MHADEYDVAVYNRIEQKKAEQNIYGDWRCTKCALLIAYSC